MVKNLVEALKGKESDVETHQAIMNLGYAEWKKNGNWGYDDMVRWMFESFGSLASFAVLTGSLNQQVENGGFTQYFSNGYGSEDSAGCSKDYKDFVLYESLIALVSELGLDKTPLGEKYLNILKVARPEIDDERYTDSTYYDEELDEEVEEEVDNENYGGIENSDDLSSASSSYYEMNEAWMAFLNTYFTEKLGD